jgi:lysophospholipase L1-like esterase
MRKLLTTIVTAAALSITPPAIQLAAVDNNGDKYWAATWGTALHAPGLGPPGFTHDGYGEQTLRQIVHTSAGGDKVRIRLSTFGAGAIVIGAARVAMSAGGAAVLPDSDRQVTFGGLTTIRVPAGAIVVSDPVDLVVPALSNLAVSVFVASLKAPPTWHFIAQQTSYVSPPGDFTTAVDMPWDSTTTAWFWLAGVDVLVPKQTGTIVAFGDSVTDGVGSSPNGNQRWPDHLAARIATEPGNHQMGVVNAGLTGNRLLRDILGPNGPARFDRDVLTQPGVTHVIVLFGNNDIIRGQLNPDDAVTSEEIIQAHQMLTARAHLRGLKIYGATLTPFKGVLTEAMFLLAEAQRQAVNQWIRTSGAYDAVIDFDLAVRDNNDPAQLNALLRADFLHPNNRGYAAMANSVNLDQFKDGKGH